MVQESVRLTFLIFAMTSAVAGTLPLSGLPSIAQITPDTTLGSDRSLVTPNVQLPTGLGDRIDGGAIRGSNLFHSFADFNVNTGQRVYFANPAAIHNIISRVTGRNFSNIDGTLGVLGTANLFLINPNGIVFGPNARLDIRGSFTASTANHIPFPDGYAFSATDPDTPPLLTVSAPLGLSSWLPSAGAIASSGNLTAGQDLNLVGHTLNLQGRMAAGRDLNLIATNELTARDTTTVPLIAAAGNRLLVQGNQAIAITALNHPQSGLVSGRDMVLRSQGAVIGDTYFRSGGNLRVEQLDGSLGNLISLQDPVFEVAGDYSLASYTGASLQILAGGSVTIPGTITINAAGGPFNDGTVILSNGAPVTLRGTTQPTLDIRAGTTQFFGTPTATGTPTSANITLGTVLNHGGQVLLTNQFQPNSTLAGDIAVGTIRTADLAFSGVPGGVVAIDSRGKITVAEINASGGNSATFNPLTNPNAIRTNGGNITLLAQGDINLPAGALVFSYGLVGGAITLQSQSAITQARTPGSRGIQSATIGVGVGNDITLTAPTISLEGAVQPQLYGTGQSGRLLLNANSLRIANQAQVFTITAGSGNAGNVIATTDAFLMDTGALFGSATITPTGGNAGDVDINTRTLTATNGGQIISFGQNLLGRGVVGNGGAIRVNATDSVLLQGVTATGQFSGISSSILPNVVGNGGPISVQTGSLILQDGGQIRSTSRGRGNTGRIDVNVRETLRIDGAVAVRGQPTPVPSGIISEVIGPSGNGTDIAIATRDLSVTNGGFISASTVSVGNAGNISIIATGSASFEGAPGGPFFPSGAYVASRENGSGNGGTLTITTSSLSVLNGARLEALTNTSGNAGNIVLRVGDRLQVQGDNSSIGANATAGSSGNGGSIFIDPDVVRVLDGGRIAVDSQGTGTAGDIVLRAGSLVLENRGLISAETVSNTGGNITLQVDDVIALRRNSRISTSAGTARAGGDGGNITINTTFLVAGPNENSDITANAFSGRGGRVDITAQGIFGFRILSRAELEAALGTTDPARLNPRFLPTSDITAISQLNPNLDGQVIVRSPDADPNRGTLPQPPEIVDASRLIAQDCTAGSELARRLGSLVITGQGGLPPSPSDPLRGDSLLLGWEHSNAATRADSTPSRAAATPPARSPVQLVEVQALENRNGRVVLVAHAPAIANQAFWSHPITCPD
ncbi:MAG: filamentous hemagglutinin N-terminal domain-containing protein [Leptolyngbyaceae cyanobacterium bins.349]|nr:filamentous hemagglutinin N-terminal domain-containing protein [Leptolyngbyaceae cyanobacterium bins.349]